MNNLIKFKNVSYRYEGDADEKPPLVLKNISFEINKGEFVAILGHNGSGKSTIAKLCNAMIIPESGKITVNGLDTSDENNEIAIRTSVGVVLQNPDNQIVATIVEEDVAFGPENLGVPQSELRKRVDDALKSVGMYEYRNHEPHKLSGGQKQRVAIAGVLAMQTECIVLDEPTAMLDPQGRIEVMNTIEKLNKKFGISVVLVTHFMEEATRADRVLVINDGEIALTGSPREVFTKSRELENIGLDVPQATKLAKTLRSMGLDMPEDILTTEEFIKSYMAVINK